MQRARLASLICDANIQPAFRVVHHVQYWTSLHPRVSRKSFIGRARCNGRDTMAGTLPPVHCCPEPPYISDYAITRCISAARAQRGIGGGGVTCIRQSLPRRVSGVWIRAARHRTIHNCTSAFWSPCFYPPLVVESSLLCTVRIATRLASKPRSMCLVPLFSFSSRPAMSHFLFLLFRRNLRSLHRLLVCRLVPFVSLKGPQRQLGHDVLTPRP